MKNTIKTRPELYQETFRPQIHFTARYWDDYRLNPQAHQEGWLNDMNGLVFLDGEYHFFAQRWWSCWLHAVSKDLIHWEELPPAFGKDDKFGGTQSGGAVIDYNNTSGLATGETPVMVAFWSSEDNMRQCISYSNDRGRTWEKYDKNPILVYPERDPKVFWYEPSAKWIMVLYGPPGNSYNLFSSTNLLEWVKIGEPILDMHECPDMFQLPLDGDAGTKKWVVVDGDGSYIIGTFDGINFTAESKKAKGDFGKHFYATMTWNCMPKEDSRRIQVAWMRSELYPVDMPFNQQTTFPCELSLRTCSEGIRLCRYPIREIGLLYSEETAMNDETVNPEDNPLKNVRGESFDIMVEIDTSKTTCEAVVILVRGSEVKYDFKSQILESCGSCIELKPKAGMIQLRILVDRLSVETFGNLGEVSITNCSQASDDEVPLSLNPVGGNVFVKSLTVQRLNSMWSRKVDEGDDL
ncbi:MAG: glycoside hydrolase family 32 protein [Kiritimatiellae bacterium]|jgi:fructan beta-fructosidase|nr:glycoside hydrolase family 32 protein [Kiritimatiellia bacterium]